MQVEPPPELQNSRLEWLEVAVRSAALFHCVHFGLLFRDSLLQQIIAAVVVFPCCCRSSAADLKLILKPTRHTDRQLITQDQSSGASHHAWRRGSFSQFQWTNFDHIDSPIVASNEHHLPVHRNWKAFDIALS